MFYLWHIIFCSYTWSFVSSLALLNLFRIWYHRSRVPQIASSNPQRRSGNVLPSPMDDLNNNGTVWDKHPVKSACNVSQILLGHRHVFL